MFLRSCTDRSHEKKGRQNLLIGDYTLWGHAAASRVGRRPALSRRPRTLSAGNYTQRWRRARSGVSCETARVRDESILRPKLPWEKRRRHAVCATGQAWKLIKWSSPIAAVLFEPVAHAPVWWFVKAAHQLFIFHLVVIHSKRLLHQTLR